MTPRLPTTAQSCAPARGASPTSFRAPEREMQRARVGPRPSVHEVQLALGPVGRRRVELRADGRDRVHERDVALRVTSAAVMRGSFGAVGVSIRRYRPGVSATTVIGRLRVPMVAQ